MNTRQVKVSIKPLAHCDANESRLSLISARSQPPDTPPKQILGLDSVANSIIVNPYYHNLLRLLIYHCTLLYCSTSTASRTNESKHGAPTVQIAC